MRKWIMMAISLIAVLSINAQDVERPEFEIKIISKKWTKISPRVETVSNDATVRDFAMAFCRQYQNYKPNASMVDYINNPGAYKYEDKHYLVEDSVNNCFIKTDMAWQCDYNTEVCCWHRTNGNTLVGVLMQIGSEGEGIDTKFALLFYDYNPLLKVMTPDRKIYKSVRDIIAKNKSGTPMVYLPKEGDCITVSYVKWTRKDDFVFKDIELKWDGEKFIKQDVQ